MQIVLGATQAIYRVTADTLKLWAFIDALNVKAISRFRETRIDGTAAVTADGTPVSVADVADGLFAVVTTDSRHIDTTRFIRVEHGHLWSVQADEIELMDEIARASNDLALLGATK